MAQKRKYTKTSPYWAERKNKEHATSASKTFGLGEGENNNLQQLVNRMGDQSRSLPKLVGTPFLQRSEASYSRTSSSSGGKASVTKTPSTYGERFVDRYGNIIEGILPFEEMNNSVSVRCAIELCQRAYFNVAIFRNAIDIMAEFANSPIHLKGGTKPARDFIQKWFQKIKIWSVKDQYFREYYRSGNVFFYRLDGKLRLDDFKKLSTAYARRKETLRLGEIPIKYVLLNPYDIVSTRSTHFEGNVYRKVLSQYELEKLKNPTCDEDRELFASLPKKTRDEIKQGLFTGSGIYMPLDPSRLSYSFYKKQDYEPFAVPFGFSILEDINRKIELKKIDQALCRSVENVILLITMGAKEEDGGIDHTAIEAMQSLFSSESAGRVLVADYTTEGKFLVPEIDKILDADKYKVLNEDIRDALQNVIVGQEKYANTQVKAKIFLERLKEARNTFLNDFLQPQIKMICKAMGFRKYPIARFQDIDIKDEVQLQRVATRLVELGVLTPDQGIKVIQTGVYPESNEMLPAQKSFRDQRAENLYIPLVGGTMEKEEEVDSEGKSKSKNAKKVAAKPEGGRPAGSTKTKSAIASELYSRKEIAKVVQKMGRLKSSLVKKFKERTHASELSEIQEGMVEKLTNSIVLSREHNEWESTAKACLKDLEKIDELKIKDEILDLSIKHTLPELPAAFMYHSKKLPE